MQQQFLAQQFDAQHRHYQRHYPDAEWLVIERGGEAIGRLYIEEWHEPDPDHRHRTAAARPRLGIGAAILEDMLSAAAAAAGKASASMSRRTIRRGGSTSASASRVDDQGVYDQMEWRPPGADPA